MPRFDDYDNHWRDLCADEKPSQVRRKRKRPRGEQPDAWRARRICGQARRSVQMGLAPCGDPLLQGLIVTDVTPGDNQRALIVHVQYLGEDHPTLTNLMARLAGVSGHLRAELAHSVRRKRVPQLCFQLDAETEDESERDPC